MRNISIKWQLIIICVLLVAIPVIILGILSFNTSKEAILDNVEETLRVQCVDWSIISQSYYDLIEENKRAARDTTKGIITSQASGVLQLIENNSKGDLTSITLKEPVSRIRQSKEDMLDTFFSIDEFNMYSKQFDKAVKNIKAIIYFLCAFINFLRKCYI